VVSEDPFETYGQCKSVQYGMLPFIIPLACLFAIVIVLTAVISYRLRDVQEDLAECRWIFYGILCHIQTWAIGIPILVITDSVSKDGFYVMMSALAFIFSTSLVSLVIWPKIYTVCSKRAGSSQYAHARISVQGGGTRISGMTDSRDSRARHSDRPTSENVQGHFEDPERPLNFDKDASPRALSAASPRPPPSKDL